MTRTQTIILISVVAGGIIAFFAYQNYMQEKLTCFDLPTSPDPDVFGSSYWHAFHKLAADIPCSHCRGFAEKFMTFFHDLVNKKLGKPIYDQANFDYFTKSIASLNAGNDINTAFGITPTS